MRIWHWYATCKCGHYEYLGVPLHGPPRQCPRCGGQWTCKQGRWLTAGVWWKPWTWFSGMMVWWDDYKRVHDWQCDRTWAKAHNWWVDWGQARRKQLRKIMVRWVKEKQ